MLTKVFGIARPLHSQFLDSSVLDLRQSTQIGSRSISFLPHPTQKHLHRDRERQEVDGNCARQIRFLRQYNNRSCEQFLMLTSVRVFANLLFLAMV